MNGGVLNRPTTFKRLDRVRLGNGQVIIVTGYHPNRPSNCYSGLLEKGHGKEYVFGPRHNPVKLGEVSEDHPALRANRVRVAQRAGVQPPQTGAVDNGSRAAIIGLLDAVEANDLDKVKFLAEILRNAGFKG